MTSRNQILLAAAGVACLAAAVAFAHYWPDYVAYVKEANAPAPVCAIGPPSRCIKARESG